MDMSKRTKKDKRPVAKIDFKPYGAAMQRSSDISLLTETDRFALAEIMAALNVL